MAVPKIELREGEKLWFERWTWPDEAPVGRLWKVTTSGKVLSCMGVPDGEVFEGNPFPGKLFCEIADEDFGRISLEDAQKLFSKSEDSE